MGREYLTATTDLERNIRRSKESDMIVLGLVLILLAALLNVPLLYTIGIILVIVGAVLWILGAMGRTVGPRTHYW